MMLPDYFATYPDPPADMTVGCAIARMIDGLGFRLHVALDGLREEDCAFRISADGKSIHDIIWHVLGLVNWIHLSVYGEQMTRPKNILGQGAETLRVLEQLRNDFAGMSDERLQSLNLDSRPFWSFLNMPLSDATHHVGQICIMRRGVGNPCVWPR